MGCYHCDILIWLLKLKILVCHGIEGTHVQLIGVTGSSPPRFCLRAHLYDAILDFSVISVLYETLIMPSIPWKPFGFNNILPRRFPRQRRGNKRQPIVPLKEWKIVRGDTVRHGTLCLQRVLDSCDLFQWNKLSNDRHIQGNMLAFGCLYIF